MLKEQTIFGEVDKVKVAMNRLCLHQPPEGYYVAFSGGKDSCVVLDLCKRAGVKYDAHYNMTTVDPPELTQFIRKKYKEAWEGRNIPEINMHDLIIEKRMPPHVAPATVVKYSKSRAAKGGSSSQAYDTQNRQSAQSGRWSKYASVKRESITFTRSSTGKTKTYGNTSRPTTSHTVSSTTRERSVSAVPCAPTKAGKV